MVYLGAFEDTQSCEKWKVEFGLEFPVVPDDSGTIFSELSNGWVPCSVLLDSEGVVVFAENEFDETGFTNAIENLFSTTPAAAAKLDAPPPKRAPHGATTTVILGGGTGGLVTAHHLRKRLPREHRVIVVDRSPDHVFEPSLLWMAVGNRRDSQIRRPLDRLERKGIEFVNASVEEIDVSGRTIRTTDSAIAFDYLVVSLGAQTVPESIEGFSAMAHDLYSPAGCQRIHEELQRFRGGNIAVLVTSMPFKCPAAPYEAAFLVEAFCRHAGIRDQTEIHVFTPEHQPMPVAEPSLGHSIVQMLGTHGIHYHPLFTFESLRPETREIVAGNGRAEHVDLLIAVPPHQAPEVVRRSALLGVSGWIHVDPLTLRTGHDNVFAIGDVTSVKLPNGKTLPKAGVFAHNEAAIVAKQIVAETRGTRSDATFDGRGYCWVELGDGKAGFASGEFYNDPDPRVKLARPGRLWHWGKVAFEKWWLRRWF